MLFFFYFIVYSLKQFALYLNKRKKKSTLANILEIIFILFKYKILFKTTNVTFGQILNNIPL